MLLVMEWKNNLVYCLRRFYILNEIILLNDKKYLPLHEMTAQARLENRMNSFYFIGLF